jgi:HlyD family secretion protein
VKRLIGVAIILALVVVAGGAVWDFGPFRRNGGLLTLPGTVEIQEVRLGSKVGGRVAAVFVREGELVKAGQELVRFEAPELEAQRDQLQARLKSAEADFKKARDGPRLEDKDEARAAWQAADAKRRRVDAGRTGKEEAPGREQMAGKVTEVFDQSQRWEAFDESATARDLPGPARRNGVDRVRPAHRPD